MAMLTALMDNQCSENKALAAEHGLSLWVEAGGRRFLFDCGASATAMANARRLGIRLEEAEFTVCSHSHYDHAAGLRDLAENGLAAPSLYVGPHFWEKKYAFDGTRYTDLSCGFDQAFLEANGIEWKQVDGLIQLAPGVWLVNGFGRTHAFETIPQRFVRGSLPGAVPDDFSDETCLALACEGGLAVVVGCSHPGILNMLDTVRQRLQQPICAVLGGTHLVEAGEERIAQTIGAMKAMGVRLLGLSHCSGAAAEGCIHADPSLQSCHLAVGDTLVL